jgi:hypothetical protein
MRKYLMLLIGLGALLGLTVGALSTASGEVAKSGNLEIEVDGNFSPKTLPKNKFAPISLSAEGKIRTLDGSHLPALREFILESDKNGAINVKGYPVCKASKIQATDTAHAKKACGSALIGKGQTDIEILFEESKAINAHSELLVFNGGVKGGKTTLYIHAYITKPVPSAVVTTVTIKKIHKGPFGLLSVAKIPKIAGGNGSPKNFSLTINKKFTYRHKRYSVLTAKCPTGKLQAHGTAVFADGTRLSAGFVRPCKGV